MTYELYIPFHCTKCDFIKSQPLAIPIVANVIIFIGYFVYSQMFIDLTIQKPSHELFDLPSFACTECDFKCGLCCHLKPHLILHISENPFSCHIDPTIQKPLYELSELSIFACNECDFKCKHCCYFKPHRILHTCEYSFLCYVCNLIVMAIQPLKPFKPINHMLKSLLDIHKLFNEYKNPLINNLLNYMSFSCTECDLVHPIIKPLPHPCHIIIYKYSLTCNTNRKCCYHILHYRTTNITLNSDCNKFINVQCRRG